MKILKFIKKNIETWTGVELRRTFQRHADAADQLDRAVKEMLQK